MAESGRGGKFVVTTQNFTVVHRFFKNVGRCWAGNVQGGGHVCACGRIDWTIDLTDSIFWPVWILHPWWSFSAFSHSPLLLHKSTDQTQCMNVWKQFSPEDVLRTSWDIIFFLGHWEQEQVSLFLWSMQRLYYYDLKIAVCVLPLVPGTT